MCLNYSLAQNIKIENSWGHEKNLRTKIYEKHGDRVTQTEQIGHN